MKKAILFTYLIFGMCSINYSMPKIIFHKPIQQVIPFPDIVCFNNRLASNIIFSSNFRFESNHILEKGFRQLVSKLSDNKTHTIVLNCLIPITSNLTIPSNIKIIYKSGNYFSTTENSYVDVKSEQSVTIEQFGGNGDDPNFDNSEALARFNTYAKNKENLVVLNLGIKKTYYHKNPRWPFNIIKLKVNGNGSTLYNNTTNGFDRYSLITAAGMSKQTGNGQEAFKVDYYLIEKANAGDNFIKVKNISGAQNLVAGEWIAVCSEDMTLKGTPPNFKYYDYVKILSINNNLGKITIAQKLKYTHRPDALWAKATTEYTGRASIYRIEQGSKWKIEQEYNDINFYASGAASPTSDYVIMSGYKLTFNRCTARAFDPTVAENIFTNNCTSATSEFDKLVTNFTDEGSTWNAIGSAMGVTNLTFNDSKIGDIVGLTPRHLRLNNVTQTGKNFTIGIRYGSLDSLSINGSSYQTEPSYSTMATQGRNVQIGISGVSYSNGILTVATTPNRNISFLSSAYIGRQLAITKPYLSRAFATNNSGIITNVSSDGTNTYVSVLFKKNVSDNDVVTISNEPKYVKMNSNSFNGRHENDRDYLKIPKSIKLENVQITPGFNLSNIETNGGIPTRVLVNVKKSYTGSSDDAILEIQGIFPQPVIELAKVDLRNKGLREITTTNNQGFLNSDFRPRARNLVVSDDNFKSGFMIKCASGLSGNNNQLPVVDIEIDLK